MRPSVRVPVARSSVGSGGAAASSSSSSSSYSSASATTTVASASTMLPSASSSFAVVESAVGGEGGKAVHVVRPTVNTASNASEEINRTPLYAHEWDGDAQTPAEAREIQFLIEDRMLKEMKRVATKRNVKASIVFTELLPIVRDGVQSIVQDDFTPCFESKAPQRWNHSPLLFLAWCIGICVRYLIFFPLRLLILLLGSCFVIGTFSLMLMLKPSARRDHVIRKLLQLWAGFFILSWFGVVRYHGVFPARRANQIFVANHSSVVDYILLLHYSPFASVSQAHPGVLGALQRVLAPLGNIMFNRFETRNRHLVTQRLQEHIADHRNPPLLIFPEGVCVNNEYCVMFRKGAFEIGATVCPVAIRYDKGMCDPYWNSRKESFMKHLFRFMSSWCVVADVYFLEPQTIREGESPIDFATRVQAMICKKARLKLCPWDGYLKYFQPNPRFKERKQKLFADMLLKEYESSTSGLPRSFTEESLDEATSASGSGELAPVDVDEADGDDDVPVRDDDAPQTVSTTCPAAAATAAVQQPEQPPASPPNSPPPHSDDAESAAATGPARRRPAGRRSRADD